MKSKTQLNLLHHLLDQARVEDPAIRQFLEKTVSTDKTDLETVKTEKEEIRRLRIQNKKLVQQMEVIKEQLKLSRTGNSEMMYNVGYLLKLSNALSEALGSCRNCWGENPECSICNGSGKPGWRTINKKMFNNYILPCLEKLSVNRLK